MKMYIENSNNKEIRHELELITNDLRKKYPEIYFECTNQTIKREVEINGVYKMKIVVKYSRRQTQYRDVYKGMVMKNAEYEYTLEINKIDELPETEKVEIIEEVKKYYNDETIKKSIETLKNCLERNCNSKGVIYSVKQRDNKLKELETQKKVLIRVNNIWRNKIIEIKKHEKIFDILQWRVDTFLQFKKENHELLNWFESHMSNWDIVSKSPYGMSFYNSNDIDWGYKPENSLRISDHWNFESDGQIHCPTDCEFENGWALAEFKNGVYHILEKFN